MSTKDLSPKKSITLDDLKSNPKNPRKISEEQKARLEKALAEFGDLSGIIFNRTTGQLVGGHQRVNALNKGAPQEVTIDRQFSPATKTGTVAEGFVMIDGERFTYREVEWDDVREKAANLAANKHGGEWDLPKLSEWLLELDGLNYDMDLVGFSDQDLANLMAPITMLPPGGDADAVPKEPKIPRSRRGDVFVLGKSRLICGDSTLLTDVEKLMNGNKADMVWTDPPYNVAYEGKTKEALTIENDEMDAQKFYDFLYQTFTNMIMSTKAGGSIYVAHADLEGINFRTAFVNSGWKLKQCLIWVKQSLVMGRSDYHWKHEPILYGWSPGAAHSWYGDRKQTTVLQFDRPSRNETHPTMKPVDLVSYMLDNSSKPGEIILDLFGGSGTTLIAAVGKGREAYLCELDPKYCDVIIQRWCEYTGKDAFRENEDGSLENWKDVK